MGRLEGNGGLKDRETCADHGTTISGEEERARAAVADSGAEGAGAGYNGDLAGEGAGWAAAGGGVGGGHSRLCWIAWLGGLELGLVRGGGVLGGKVMPSMWTLERRVVRFVWRKSTFVFHRRYVRCESGLLRMSSLICWRVLIVPPHLHI